MRVHSLVLAGLAGVMLASCAVQPPTSEGQGATPSPKVSVSQTPEAPPPPPAPPTPEPTERVQGSNHSHEASRYAFPAKDVHNWLVKGKEASNYPTRKIAFLTFDDGPNNGTTPLVLDILKKKKVRATFFYIGERWVLDRRIPRSSSGRSGRGTR